jgi:hypothetical protein
MTRTDVLDMARRLHGDVQLTAGELSDAAEMLEALAPAEAIQNGSRSFGCRCNCVSAGGKFVSLCPDHTREVNQRAAEIRALQDASKS